MTQSRNPVKRNKLPGSKWTATRPRQREKHFVVVDWVRNDDGSPTERVEIEAVVTGSVRVLHWRELENTDAWRIGWV